MPAYKVDGERNWLEKKRARPELKPQRTGSGGRAKFGLATSGKREIKNVTPCMACCMKEKDTVPDNSIINLHDIIMTR